jgi:GTP cyclohydrolase III
VVYYTQWRSRTDFEAMLQDPQARVHMELAASIAASVDPVVFELRYSDQGEVTS